MRQIPRVADADAQPADPPQGAGELQRRDVLAVLPLPPPGDLRVLRLLALGLANPDRDAPGGAPVENTPHDEPGPLPPDRAEVQPRGELPLVDARNADRRIGEPEPHLGGIPLGD